MSAENGDKVRVPRDRLYADVWSEPVDAVARRYGLSGRGLGKLCKREGVPLPPRGYWAKLRAGKKPRQTPLPTAPVQPVVEIRRHPTTASPPEEAPFDARVAAFLAKLSKSAPAEVQPDLANCHSVTRAAAKDLASRRAKRERGEHIWSDPSWGPDVSEALEPRALLIFDAIARELRTQGIALTLWDHRVGAWAMVLGRRFRVCVRERLRRTRRPAKNLEAWDREHDFAHRGKLEIRIDDGKSMNAYAWQDGLTPLEQRVGEILPKVLRRIDAELRREAKWAAERKREEEQRRVAQAAEARRRDEAQRRARLVREAIRWRRARIVREFVAAVEQELMTRDSSPGVTEHLTQWRGWTAMVLKELDPLPRRIATELAAAASPVSRQTP